MRAECRIEVVEPECDVEVSRLDTVAVIVYKQEHRDQSDRTSLSEHAQCERRRWVQGLPNRPLRLSRVTERSVIQGQLSLRVRAAGDMHADCVLRSQASMEKQETNIGQGLTLARKLGENVPCLHAVVAQRRESRGRRCSQVDSHTRELGRVDGSKP